MKTYLTRSPFGPAGPGIPGGPIRPFGGKGKYLDNSVFNKSKSSECHSHEGRESTSRATSISELTMHFYPLPFFLLGADYIYFLGK